MRLPSMAWMLALAAIAAMFNANVTQGQVLWRADFESAKPGPVPTRPHQLPEAGVSEVFNGTVRIAPQQDSGAALSTGQMLILEQKDKPAGGIIIDGLKPTAAGDVLVISFDAQRLEPQQAMPNLIFRLRRTGRTEGGEAAVMSYPMPVRTTVVVNTTAAKIPLPFDTPHDADSPDAVDPGCVTMYVRLPNGSYQVNPALGVDRPLQLADDRAFDGFLLLEGTPPVPRRFAIDNFIVTRSLPLKVDGLPLLEWKPGTVPPTDDHVDQ